MVGERETAVDMFKRQQREREIFLVEQARRLNDAGFDWDLPVEFRVKHALVGIGGLPIVEVTREELSSGGLSIILHHQRGLLLVNKEGQVGEYPTEDVPRWLFGIIEQNVNETLAELQVVTTAGSSS